VGGITESRDGAQANGEVQPGSPQPSSADGGGAPGRSGRSRTLWSDASRRLRRNKLAMIGLAWILVVVVVALTADLWAPQWLGSPSEFDSTTMGELKHLPPSLDHPFGTDKRGLDVASRIVYGARYSLAVGIIATSIALVLGLIMGTLAAYYSGLIDSVVMRLADVFLAFPYILFAIALITVLGRGFVNLFIAIGVLAWPTIARVVRSSILSVKENEYVDAARALGASDARIMLRHMLPNAMAPIIVYGTMSIGSAILSEAALSFLGLGVQFPDPSWGHMLSEARGEMISYPWLMIFPGAAILTTVLAFVLLGDGLRDALDVKMKD